MRRTGTNSGKTEVKEERERGGQIGTFLCIVWSYILSLEKTVFSFLFQFPFPFPVSVLNNVEVLFLDTVL